METKKDNYYWSDEDVVRIQHYLDNGRTVSEIADYYDVSRQRIYQVMRKFDIKTPRKK